ncbi:hypothetical protein PARPLA_01065 [Rhodobacteraceae bacterium THAF1]|uniref:hypothetical protein n=1 Tax=Palleronia sp. THAF1 TaxID=2587842 RepID=UPI000F3AEF23|nr:hypothetical protein [Palleronia sp. THAF1]QFU07412.1 hypothetical protein FIU81_01855 [Palleronia sp. THAF1]VDC20676.1 hypothetical protein PARPLA_01065 [Rhodobacteraceae bacterium THAF1]
MPLIKTFARFARCQSGAFTTDWVLQVALVGAICMGVLTSVTSTETSYNTADTHYNGHIVTTQYP